MVGQIKTQATKTLALHRVAALRLEPSDEIRRWYAIIACTIQRTNAKILRGEAVPAARSAPSSFWAAMAKVSSMSEKWGGKCDFITDPLGNSGGVFGLFLLPL